ncbi:MAG: hypothetical protein J0M25_04480 [Flavobacteriales bacterium]|nr:hypothetical protein [Flavobacteriales bacterium]
MKNLLYFIILLPFASFSQIGINTTLPNAMLDVSATNQGILLPRVALTSALDNVTVINPQGGAIATSTMVYNTSTAGVSPNNVIPGYYYWNGSRWVAVGSDGRDWSTSGNSGTNPTNNFIGSIDDVDFRVRTNNNPRFNFSNNGRLRAYDNGIVTQPTYSWMGDEDTGVWRPAANTLDLATAGVSRIRVNSDGNVGIGATDTPARLTVLANRNVPAFPNLTSNGILRIAVNGSEGLDIGKTDGTGGFSAWIQSGFSGTADPLSLQPLGGNVGINVVAPTNSLHVNGTVRIVDGTQANGRVLTSNATGVASWQPISINNVVGNLVGTGINIPSSTTNFLQTGSSITLPPGRWAVNVTMLMRRTGGTGVATPNDSSYWLRTSFSTSALINPAITADIVGSYYVSGNYPGSSLYSLVQGTVVINNATAANRTYYYIAGAVEVINSTNTLENFGGAWWQENTIIAYRIN